MAEMRVMLDTNVLLSALLFPGARINQMMQSIFEEHRLVLSSFVVEELTYVVKRKLMCGRFFGMLISISKSATHYFLHTKGTQSVEMLIAFCFLK